MKPVIFLIACMMCFAPLALQAQDAEVPEQYTLKVADDYKKYEPTVIACAKWLQTAAFDEHEQKRLKISKFILDWVNGSPTVFVELNPTIFDFNKRNPGMLIIFMASSAQYVLENDYSKDMLAKHRFALRAMIKVYQADLGIKKDRKMDKLIAADAEGKLDEWMERNLKIAK